MKIKLNDIDLLLLPQRLLYLPRYQTLCIADWHLGKAAHFRKAGIGLPQYHQDNGFDIINESVNQLKINTILFLGDLFHSIKNNEWAPFRSFVERHNTIDFILIKGNHDIIPDEYFQDIGVRPVDWLMTDNKLYFTHHPLYEQTPQRCLNIAGHVHPACVIEQKARQSVRLPCFYYREKTLLLPAFGKMTGMHMLESRHHDLVFPVFHNEVIQLKKT